MRSVCSLVFARSSGCVATVAADAAAKPQKPLTHGGNKSLSFSFGESPVFSLPSPAVPPTFETPHVTTAASRMCSYTTKYTTLNGHHVKLLAQYPRNTPE